MTRYDAIFVRKHNIQMERMGVSSDGIRMISRKLARFLGSCTPYFIIHSMFRIMCGKAQDTRTVSMFVGRLTQMAHGRVGSGGTRLCREANVKQSKQSNLFGASLRPRKRDSDAGSRGTRNDKLPARGDTRAFHSCSSIQIFGRRHSITTLNGQGTRRNVL